MAVSQRVVFCTPEPEPLVALLDPNFFHYLFWLLKSAVLFAFSGELLTCVGRLKSTFSKVKSNMFCSEIGKTNPQHNNICTHLTFIFFWQVQKHVFSPVFPGQICPGCTCPGPNKDGSQAFSRTSKRFVDVRV